MDCQCAKIRFLLPDKTNEVKKSGQNDFKPGPGTTSDSRVLGLITELQNMINGDNAGQFTTLTCRSIRIGSYKILTKEKVSVEICVSSNLNNIFFPGVFHTKSNFSENSILNGPRQAGYYCGTPK